MIRKNKILFIPAFMEIMNYLNDNNNTNIIIVSHDLYITYSHVSKVIKELNKNDFIKIKKIGRCCFIELTKKGIYLSKLSHELKMVVEKNDKRKD